MGKSRERWRKGLRRRLKVELVVVYMRDWVDMR